MLIRLSNTRRTFSAFDFFFHVPPRADWTLGTIFDFVNYHRYLHPRVKGSTMWKSIWLDLNYLMIQASCVLGYQDTFHIAETFRSIKSKAGIVYSHSLFFFSFCSIEPKQVTYIDLQQQHVKLYEPYKRVPHDQCVLTPKAHSSIPHWLRSSAGFLIT